MNDFLVRCFQRSNIPTIKEPTGLMEEGSLRPDGYTISPWAQGRSLAWDVTFPHTMPERNFIFSSNGGSDVPVEAPKTGAFKDLSENADTHAVLNCLLQHVKGCNFILIFLAKLPGFFYKFHNIALNAEKSAIFLPLILLTMFNNTVPRPLVELYETYVNGNELLVEISDCIVAET
ncbi:hypothetical protein HELRODRAFT_178232 [Helobdella robusta]|uniref:Uncharacterized protein n=1 Tax=Helobdella robusta TaxID=6412 RepID=T1FCZ0_HELRO|nr:hypothetical protein HELRODRAFT_178232 [Helobdella robusta]ESN97435.1 hypothetical protein HELRODRAFT_178232 [Helobdella robusta]